MENFPKYYTRLFNGITDALEAIQNQNYIEAQDILIKAQQDAEEMYLEDGDEEDDQGDETESSPKYYSWQADRTLEESRTLEEEHLFHKSCEAFQKLLQEQETCPEDPPPNH